MKGKRLAFDSRWLNSRCCQSQTGATVAGFTMMMMLQLQGDISIGCYNCRVYFLEFLKDVTITGMENRNVRYIYGVGSKALG